MLTSRGAGVHLLKSAIFSPRDDSIQPIHETRDIRMKKAIVVFSTVGCFLAGYASASPIFVYHESDGSIRFTNHAPPTGVKAEVFSHRAGSFAHYSYGAWPKFRTAEMAKKYEDLIQEVATSYSVDPAL